MAHMEQRDFFTRMRERFPEAFTETALEVGSLNINGTVRDFFDCTEYVGIDIVDGPGVDRVMDGSSLSFVDNWFYTVVSAECFEHNKDWVETFREMWRVASGMVFFTCASTGRPEHGTHGSLPFESPGTNDYYRNLEANDFVEAFDLLKMFSDFAFEYNPISCDLYFWGIKRGA